MNPLRALSALVLTLLTFAAYVLWTTDSVEATVVATLMMTLMVTLYIFTPKR